MKKISDPFLFAAGKFSTLLILAGLLLFLSSCGIQKQLLKEVKTDIFGDSVLQHAHIGLTIFDAASEKYLYNYQGLSLIHI